jgi:glycosyltransferase involved in cell wall biosynthesis
MIQSESKPLITVVTVVLNGQDVIEETIKSVIGQNYNSFEYIVIDGNSIDKTPEIISQYHDQIDLSIRESDSGIYDAMNKAISKARGKYINFLNAGDTFYGKDILKRVSVVLENKQPDLFYARQEFFWPQKERTMILGRELTLNNIKRGEAALHQTMFTKTTLLNQLGGFDTRYKIAADYDLLYRIYLKDSNLFFANMITTRFPIGGASSDSKTTYREMLLIIKKHSNLYYYLLYFIVGGFRLIVRPFFKRYTTGPIRKFLKQI